MYYLDAEASERASERERGRERERERERERAMIFLQCIDKMNPNIQLLEATYNLSDGANGAD